MFTFADDVSVIICHHEKNHFRNWIYGAFAELKCFQADTFELNVDKTITEIC